MGLGGDASFKLRENGQRFKISAMQKLTVYARIRVTLQLMISSFFHIYQSVDSMRNSKLFLDIARILLKLQCRITSHTRRDTLLLASTDVYVGSQSAFGALFHRTAAI